MGTEVFCVVRAQRDPHTTRLAVRELPTSPGVIGIETYRVMQLFVNGSKPPVSIAAALSPEQVEQLRPFPPEPTNGRPPIGLRADDWPLVQALIDDGRATYRQLAERTHWHESTVRGRIEELLHAQVLYFDLDVDNDALGLTTRAVLWLSVTPARLTDVGNALAEHPEVPIVAATTGATNLLAPVVCDNDRALYEYLTQRVAKVKGVTSIETVPSSSPSSATSPFARRSPIRPSTLCQGLDSQMLTAWHTAFATHAEIGATLTGLVFVALALNLTRILATPGLPGRAGEALLLLLMVVFAGLAGRCHKRSRPSALS